jgi:hypothetical protein
MSNMIPTAPMFQAQQFVPPDQIQRFGPGQTLHMIHYDTPLAGRGQTLGAETQLFNSPNRLGNPDLCSLAEAGKFSDFKQFAVYAIGMQMFYNQTTGVVPTPGAPTAEDLLSLAVYYSRIHIYYQNAEKQILWSDQLPAGGGVYGFSNTANSFHLTNGVPSAHCKFYLKEPLIITPQKTFRLTLKWNSSLNGNVAPFSTTQDPLNAFNAALTADKLMRIYLHGIEIRDITNG